MSEGSVSLNPKADFAEVAGVCVCVKWESTSFGGRMLWSSCVKPHAMHRDSR